jgi:phosphotriesterase-related protein
MDAARQGYYRSYGGSPGLAYLLETFSGELAARGIPSDVRDSMFIGAPGRAFAFAEGGG